MFSSLLLSILLAFPGPGSTLGSFPTRTVSPRPAVPETTSLLAGRTVVLSVDDGYHSVFTNIYPLLKRHRMTITLGIICDYLRGGSPSYQRGAGFVRRTEVQEMIDSCGIEVASHSLSHPFLTRLDSAAAWREIHDSKVILESLFGEEVVTFVYPYGDLDARTVRMVQAAGYRMGRAVREGRFNLETDPWRLPTVELRLETPLQTVKRQIQDRSVTILLLHQIVERPRVFTEWPLDDFARLLEWLESGGARVTTLRQLYREWRQERLGPMMKEVAAAFPDERKRLSFQQVHVDATQAPNAR